MIDSYIDILFENCPTISEIWLFGSRANDCFHDESDWDLLVFTDDFLLTKQAVLSDSTLHRSDVDLFIMEAENSFVSVLGQEQKICNLVEWNWNVDTDDDAKATYQSEKLIVDPDGEPGEDCMVPVVKTMHAHRLVKRT